MAEPTKTTDFTNPSGGPGGGGWCRPSQRPNERPDPVIKDTRIRPWDRTPKWWEVALLGLILIPLTMWVLARVH